MVSEEQVRKVVEWGRVHGLGMKSIEDYQKAKAMMPLEFPYSDPMEFAANPVDASMGEELQSVAAENAKRRAMVEANASARARENLDMVVSEENPNGVVGTPDSDDKLLYLQKMAQAQGLTFDTEREAQEFFHRTLSPQSGEVHEDPWFNSALDIASGGTGAILAKGGVTAAKLAGETTAQLLKRQLTEEIAGELGAAAGMGVARQIAPNSVAAQIASGLLGGFTGGGLDQAFRNPQATGQLLKRGVKGGINKIGDDISANKQVVWDALDNGKKTVTDLVDRLKPDRPSLADEAMERLSPQVEVVNDQNAHMLAKQKSKENPLKMYQTPDGAIYRDGELIASSAEITRSISNTEVAPEVPPKGYGLGNRTNDTNPTPETTTEALSTLNNETPPVASVEAVQPKGEVPSTSTALVPVRQTPEVLSLEILPFSGAENQDALDMVSDFLRNSTPGTDCLALPAPAPSQSTTAVVGKPPEPASVIVGYPPEPVPAGKMPETPLAETITSVGIDGAKVAKTVNKRPQRPGTRLPSYAKVPYDRSKVGWVRASLRRVMDKLKVNSAVGFLSEIKGNDGSWKPFFDQTKGESIFEKVLSELSVESKMPKSELRSMLYGLAFDPNNEHSIVNPKTGEVTIGTAVDKYTFREGLDPNRVRNSEKLARDGWEVGLLGEMDRNRASTRSVFDETGATGRVEPDPFDISQPSKKSLVELENGEKVSVPESEIQVVDSGKTEGYVSERLNRDVEVAEERDVHPFDRKPYERPAASDIELDVPHVRMNYHQADTVAPDAVARYMKFKGASGKNLPNEEIEELVKFSKEWDAKANGSPEDAIAREWFNGGYGRVDDISYSPQVMKNEAEFFPGEYEAAIDGISKKLGLPRNLAEFLLDNISESGGHLDNRLNLARNSVMPGDRRLQLDADNRASEKSAVRGVVNAEKNAGVDITPDHLADSGYGDTTKRKIREKSLTAKKARAAMETDSEKYTQVEVARKIMDKLESLPEEERRRVARRQLALATKHETGLRGNDLANEIKTRLEGDFGNTVGETFLIREAKGNPMSRQELESYASKLRSSKEASEALHDLDHEVGEADLKLNETMNAQYADRSLDAGKKRPPVEEMDKSDAVWAEEPLDPEEAAIENLSDEDFQAQIDSIDESITANSERALANKVKKTPSVESSREMVDAGESALEMGRNARLSDAEKLTAAIHKYADYLAPKKGSNGTPVLTDKHVFEIAEYMPPKQRDASLKIYESPKSVSPDERLDTLSAFWRLSKDVLHEMGGKKGKLPSERPRLGILGGGFASPAIEKAIPLVNAFSRWFLNPKVGISAKALARTNDIHHGIDLVKRFGSGEIERLSKQFDNNTLKKVLHYASLPTGEKALTRLNVSKQTRENLSKLQDMIAPYLQVEFGSSDLSHLMDRGYFLSTKHKVKVSHNASLEFIEGMVKGGYVSSTSLENSINKAADLFTRLTDGGPRSPEFRKALTDLEKALGTKLEDAPQFVKAILGGVSDPQAVLSSNLNYLVDSVAQERMISSVIDLYKSGDNSVLTAKKTIGHKRIPDNIPEIGGMYAPKYVADRIISNQKELGKLARMGAHVQTIFKKGKVFYNAGAYGRNFISNMLLSEIGGVPLHYQAKTLPGVVKDLRAFSKTGKMAPWLEEAMENGVLRGTMTAGDLNMLKKSLAAYDCVGEGGFEGMLESINQFMSSNKIGSAGEGAYEFIEDISRLTAYRYYMENGIPQGLTEKVNRGDVFLPENTKVSPKEAVEEVNRWLFDYSEVPEFVDAMRKSAVPFITFPYYASRAIGRAAKDGKVGLLSAFALVKGLQTAIESSTGEHLNVDSIFPTWSVLTDGDDQRYGKSTSSKLTGAPNRAGELMDNFLPGGPATLPLELAGNYSLFKGEEIGDGKDKAKHVAETLLPKTPMSIAKYLSGDRKFSTRNILSDLGISFSKNTRGRVEWQYGTRIKDEIQAYCRFKERNKDRPDLIERRKKKAKKQIKKFREKIEATKVKSG